jgi:hypothetical protein
MRDDPQLNSPPLLATIKRLCDGLLSGQMAPAGDKVIIVDDCQVNVTPTLKGPVINGVPDPSVAWSAYAFVYDVRVDLYGCGPTPRSAVECLLRDVERNVARLASMNKLKADDEFIDRLHGPAVRCSLSGEECKALGVEEDDVVMVRFFRSKTNAGERLQVHDVLGRYIGVIAHEEKP